MTVAIEPAHYRHVVVPLDGSDFAGRALRPGAALASAFGAVLHAVGVVTDEADAEGLHEHLESVEARSDLGPVAVSVVHALDVADAIADAIADVATQLPPSVVCMASHGRGRVAGAAVGSVAMSVLTRFRHPVVLIGPHVEPIWVPAERPILACVDGSTASEATLPVAAAWALALELPLRVVTVAEPVPAPLDGRPYQRAHGPDVDADSYVEQLAHTWARDNLAVDPLAIYHPLSPAQGIADHLEREPATLVAVTTHARTRLAHALLGSTTARLVHDSPVPLLVTPIAR
jgi:nucleotide-binding universal stress UspA family protein